MNKPAMQEQNALPAVITTTFVSRGDAPSEACTLVAMTLPPHYPGAAPHLHPQHSEGCYVLEGTVAITYDTQTIVLSCGASLFVPPGVVHTCWNPTAVAATVLLIFQPAASATDIAALVELSGGSGAHPC